MRFKVLTVGRGGCDWADAATQDYARRLRRHGSIDELSVKPEKFRGDVDAVRRAEGERLLGQVGPRDRLVALDERGEALTSEAFAALVKEARLSGDQHMVFALGGPYGHDPAVRKQARHVLRLSTMVLNHEVARVVLYEQLYRAMSILEGSPYHH